MFVRTNSGHCGPGYCPELWDWFAIHGRAGVVASVFAVLEELLSPPQLKPSARGPGSRTFREVDADVVAAARSAGLPQRQVCWRFTKTSGRRYPPAPRTTSVRRVEGHGHVPAWPCDPTSGRGLQRLLPCPWLSDRPPVSLIRFVTSGLPAASEALRKDSRACWRSGSLRRGSQDCLRNAVRREPVRRRRRAVKRGEPAIAHGAAETTLPSRQLRTGTRRRARRDRPPPLPQ